MMMRPKCVKFVSKAYFRRVSTYVDTNRANTLEW